MREFMIYLDQQKGKRFIIRELDDTHLFIDAEYVEYVEEEMEKFLNEHVYPSTEDARSYAAR